MGKNNDNNFIEVVSGNIFSGKKLKPVVSVGRTIVNTVENQFRCPESLSTLKLSEDEKVFRQ